jgi:hypothetical protein
MPEIYRTIAERFELTRTTRPYLTRDGSVSVRLVLRGRDPSEAPETMVLHWTLRGTLSEELLDLLAAAIGPKMRVCVGGDVVRG